VATATRIATQILWCARCQTAFIFSGTPVERAVSGKLAVRHTDCEGLNEIQPRGVTDEGDGLYVVVGQVETAH
jgi:hypothetical protein